MDLILLVLGLALVGFFVYWITNKVPMDPSFKVGIQVIVGLVVLLYLLRMFGGSVPNVLP